jgi:hypothetical protein
MTRSKSDSRAPLLRVIPIAEWCAARGVSYHTAWRLGRTGRLRITQLSPGRIGVREDHDREYLESCLRPAGASTNPSTS